MDPYPSPYPYLPTKTTAQRGRSHVTVNGLEVSWYKHSLLVNTNGLGIAKLPRKPSRKRSESVFLVATMIHV